jgi:DNA polymerase III alpha subunit
MTTRRDFLKATAVAPLMDMLPKAAASTEPLVPNDRSEYLRSLCEEGLRRRYVTEPDKYKCGSLSKAVQDRLSKELRIIKQLGLVNPFLILWSTIQHARKNNALASVLGSASGSLLVYALGPSRVCPLKHGLLFERFLDSSQTKPPEFWICLCQEGLEAVTKFVRQEHGDRGARVEDWGFRIGNNIAMLSLSGQLRVDGFRSPLLTSLRRTVQLIRQRYNTTIELDQLPENDRRTYSLLQQADTEGIWQFESPNVRSVLRKLKPDSIHDLIATIAMRRPGPLSESMMDSYIDRKHGREKVDYQHPVVQEILDETYGLMPYQEQAMQLLFRLGGIELSEGFKLLKAISLNKHEIIHTQQERFMTGARERGIEKATASNIFAMIVYFGGLCFCKAHATENAYLAYQMAYLKAHYPKEFAEVIKWTTPTD